MGAPLLRPVLLASLAVLPLAGAASRDAQLFRGTVANTAVEMIVVARGGGDILGASYRPPVDRSAGWDLPLPPARLLTGKREGDRLVLREWTAPGEESAAISAVVSATTVRGTWRDTGGAPLPLVMRLEPEPFRGGPPATRSHMADYGHRLDRPVIDRLHDAVRASRWTDARFDAQLLCAVSFALPQADGCAWIDVIDGLADGRDPAPAPHAGWNGLVLEHQHLIDAAYDAYMRSCANGPTRSACAFLVDIVDRVGPQERRAALGKACSYARLGCEEYWGRNEVALVEAARRGDAAGATQALRPGVDVNAGGEGMFLTPLQAAILAQSLPVVQVLVAAGADPNHAVKNTGVGLPLDYAVNNALDDIAMWLLQHGAKANTGRALTFAVLKRKPAIVRQILENGEAPDYTPSFDSTPPLTIAVEQRDVELVKILLAHGADPAITGKFSDSPIQVAIRTGQRTILSLLLEAQAKRGVRTP